MKLGHRLAAVVAVAALSSSATAFAWTWGNRTKVGSVYVNEYNSAYIDVTVGQACGTGHPSETRLNIRAGAEGQDQLLKLATSALLSGKAIDVGVAWDSADGGFCKLERIRLIGG